MTFDVKPQLEQILSKDKFIQIEKNIHKSILNNEGLLNNAMDGSVYQDFVRTKPTKTSFTISLNINSDGAPLVNSKNIAMWPLMASITELNPSSRESFSNLIFLGYLIKSFNVVITI